MKFLTRTAEHPWPQLKSAILLVENLSTSQSNSYKFNIAVSYDFCMVSCDSVFESCESGLINHVTLYLCHVTQGDHGGRCWEGSLGGCLP